MLEIRLYFSRNLWRVKRSDKEVSTFTDPDFIPAYIVASNWSIQDSARLIVIGKQDIGIGQIDFCRLDIEEDIHVAVKPDDEDKDQVMVDLEEVDNV